MVVLTRENTDVFKLDTLHNVIFLEVESRAKYTIVQKPYSICTQNNLPLKLCLYGTITSFSLVQVVCNVFFDVSKKIYYFDTHERER